MEALMAAVGNMGIVLENWLNRPGEKNWA